MGGTSESGFIPLSDTPVSLIPNSATPDYSKPLGIKSAIVLWELALESALQALGSLDMWGYVDSNGFNITSLWMVYFGKFLFLFISEVYLRNSIWGAIK